jgi:hypothetical protein
MPLPYENTSIGVLKNYPDRTPRNAMVELLLLMIRIYQIALSPVLGPACRFEPTCSEYAYQAIASYGWVRGSLLAIKRILRCHPFNPGGFDPVP